MKFKQNKKLLIGSKKAIAALEKKDYARLLVISDSHGNFERFYSIMERYGSNCDALIFCGDGFSDLVTLFSMAKKNAPAEKYIPPVIAFVRGNCDPQRLLLGDKEITAPVEQSLVVNGHKILVVHGHAHGVDFGMDKLGLQMKLDSYDTVFYGHTHIASQQLAGDFRFINPGSCARPRGGQVPSLAIATVGKDFIDMSFINASTFENWTPLA
jgi:putative phosphoesterase